MELDTDAQTTLNDIRWHWDDAYLIEYLDGTWTATSMDFRQEVITSEDVFEFRNLLRDDYAKYQPRKPISQPDRRG
jgi:hypothetical protein